MGRYRPKPPKSSQYITPEGAAELKRELDYLWRVKRPDVTSAVAAAAAQGDRSENAEYIYGKRQLAEIDRRVRFLRKRLDGMRIVAEPPAGTGKIYFGAWLEVRDEHGTTTRHRVVGPDESGAAPEYLSMDAPLARAVMGKSVGEEVVVRTPGGERQFEITEINYVGAASLVGAASRRDSENSRPEAAPTTKKKPGT
jgi:transcription elongation factor GreB